MRTLTQHHRLRQSTGHRHRDPHPKHTPNQLRLRHGFGLRDTKLHAEYGCMDIGSYALCHAI